MFHAPAIYKVSLPTSEDIRCGDAISLRLMALEANAALHMVDTATHS